MTAGLDLGDKYFYLCLIDQHSGEIMVYTTSNTRIMPVSGALKACCYCLTASLAHLGSLFTA
jgi:hypothetical protein